MKILTHERVEIPEDKRAIYEEVVALFLKHFPSGAIMVDTSKSGACPEVRVGPYNCACGQHPWAIVKHPDGRREIVDWPKDTVMLGMGYGPRAERINAIAEME